MKEPLRKDDPVYYKMMLKRMIDMAKSNGLEVYHKDSKVYFKADNGECVGVEV